MIKYVLLDVYNLVHRRNAKFIPAVIQQISDSTRFSWDECAFAFTEEVNFFRSINFDGAFVCSPFKFAEQLLSQLEGSAYDPFQLHCDIFKVSLDHPPEVTEESDALIKWIESDTRLHVGMIANTNLLTTQEIATHLTRKFQFTNVDLNMLAQLTPALMPLDSTWRRVVVNSGVAPQEILFMTTNSKYAKAAQLAGLDVAVISDPSEMKKVVERKLGH